MEIVNGHTKTLQRRKKFVKMPVMHITISRRKPPFGNWKIEIKNSFFKRFFGWMGTAIPRPNTGIYLTPCTGVHTWGMKFTIDAVYLDRTGKILDIRTLTPGKLGPIHGQARGVLELPGGTCAAGGLVIGEYLQQKPQIGW